MFTHGGRGIAHIERQHGNHGDGHRFTASNTLWLAIDEVIQRHRRIAGSAKRDECGRADDASTAGDEEFFI